jgi:hypothetical protein
MISQLTPTTGTTTRPWFRAGQRIRTTDGTASVGAAWDRVNQACPQEPVGGFGVWSPGDAIVPFEPSRERPAHAPPVFGCPNSLTSATRDLPTYLLDELNWPCTTGWQS